MSDAVVGSILGYLRLDRSDWDTELEAAGRKADELARHSPDIKIGTNAPSAIAQLAAVAAAVKRLQDAQGAETNVESKLSALRAQEATITQKLADAEARRQRGIASQDLGPQLTAAKERKAALAEQELLTAKIAKAEGDLTKIRRVEALATVQLAAAHDKNDQAMMKAAADSVKLAQKMQTEADAANKATFSYRTWIDTLALVGPALVPITGAAGGLAVGLTGVAAAAALAFKGIQQEMQNNTQIGQQFAAGLSTMSSDLQNLEHVAASGILSGFNASVTTLSAGMRQFQPTVTTLSSLLGQTLSHSATGLVAILKDLEPLFITVGQVVEQLSVKFAHWAQSTTGVSSFVAYAQREIPVVLHVLADLGTIISHVLQAMAPMGGVVLGAFGVLAHAIAAIPVDVLRVLIPLAVDGYIAFRAYQGLSVVSGVLVGLAQKFGILGYSTVQASLQTAASAAATVAAEDAATVSVAADQVTQARARLTTAESAAAVAALVAQADGVVETAATQAAAAVVLASREEVAAADAAAVAAQRQATLSESAAAQAALAARLEAESVVASGEAASAGWIGMLGPVGAVTVGVGLLATMFMGSSDSAKQAAAGVDTLTQALIASNGALSDNVRNTVAKTLSDNGALAAARELGISLSTVTDAAMGNSAAYKDVLTQMAAVDKASVAAKESGKISADQLGKEQIASVALGNALGTQNSVMANAIQKAKDYAAANKADAASAGATTTQITQLGMAYGLTATQVQNYAVMSGILGTDLANGNVTLAQVTQSVKVVSKAYDTASQSTNAYLQAVSAFSQSAGTAADRAALIGATLKNGNGDLLAYTSSLAGATDANRQMTISFQSQTKDVVLGIKSFRDTEIAAINLKTGMIDLTKSGALPLTQQLTAIQTAAMNAAEATYQHEIATRGASTAADDAYKEYVNQTSVALVSEAQQLGLTAKQAKLLADRYFGMPKDVKTRIEQEGADPIVTILDKIGAMLAAITGQPWVSNVDANTKPAVAAVSSFQEALKTLHDIKLGVYLDTSEAVANIKALANTIASLPSSVQNKVGQRAQSFAAGGTSGEGPSGTVYGPGTSTSDSIITRLSTGEEVTNARSASMFRPLLKAINNATTPKLTMPTGYAVSGGRAPQSAPQVQMPSTLVIQDINGQLIGTMKVIAQSEATGVVHAQVQELSYNR